ncbi:hypothetical protein CDAR_499311 [Caerostris darwini]|uniref:Uncharacterized protein n=1 Tax=Caerostris darwini TaxID=1538125 RepID=A0AAV4P5F9_9ARAC|nr:hypothetical protein CDAR_499311 [Caerostris darwini]
MQSNKIYVLCLAGFILLAGVIECKPAPQGHVHHYKVGGGGDNDGGSHVHKVIHKGNFFLLYDFPEFVLETNQIKW